MAGSESESERCALVLSGGGVAGIAWHTGMLAGLAAAGLDLARFHLIVGTSAGAIVGAQIAANRSPDALYRRQLGPAVTTGLGHWLGEARLTLQNWEMDLLYARFPRVKRLWEHVDEMTPAWAARFGTIALHAPTVPEELWVRGIQRTMGVKEWPARHLAVCAVDAATGERRVFDWTAAAPLRRVVAASTALPTVAPPITVHGHRYIDGGFCTLTNADVAAGCERVVILIVDRLGTTGLPGLHRRGLAADLARLREAGSKAVVLAADEASLAAMQPSHHDPETRARTACAGYTQGQACAAQVRAFLRRGAPTHLPRRDDVANLKASPPAPSPHGERG